MAKQSVFRVDTKVPDGEKPRYYEVAAGSVEDAKAEIERIEQGLADAAPGNGSKASQSRKAGKTVEL